MSLTNYHPPFTMVWCDDCDRNEVVCECVDNPVRDNACYELEQSEKCKHKEKAG